MKGENSVKIFGPSLHELERLSKAVKDELAKVPGITDPAAFNLLGQPNLLIQVDRAKAARYGITVSDMNTVVQAAIGGQEVTRVYDGEMNFPLTVRLAAQYRDQIRMLQRILSGQAAEATGAGDVDIIVAVEREGTWCVTLAMVRGGRHLGDRSFFPANAAGSDAATVIESFISQHYAQQPVPGRVVCDQVENASEMETLLADIAALDADELSPREALEVLYALKRTAAKRE